MTTFTVTAGNSFFWQSLVVDAGSRKEAAAKFRAYLAADKAGEDEEFHEASALSPDADRDDYSYGFDDDTIEEGDDALRDWTGSPSSDVQRVDAGGNG